MATIKSFTDLEQSKKLAEILPLESADMCWQYQKDRWVGEPDYNEFPQFEHATDKRDIPCWSLAALLDVLPTLDGRNAILCKDIRYDKWHVCYHSTAILSIIDTERYDNPIDACVAMIEKLHKLNLL